MQFNPIINNITTKSIFNTILKIISTKDLSKNNDKDSNLKTIPKFNKIKNRPIVCFFKKGGKLLETRNKIKKK